MSKHEELNWIEAQEIADFLTKTDNPNEDYSITENALADKWNISADDFHEIANGIFKMIDFSISPLTHTAIVGISKGNEWLAKKEVNQQFIHAVIEWLADGEDLSKVKGMVREISSKGVLEYKITIQKLPKMVATSGTIIKNTEKLKTNTNN